MRKLQRSLIMIGVLLSIVGSLDAQIVGKAFRDYNGDGTQQGGEPGRDGIIVNAYSNVPAPGTDLLVATTTTGTDGSYTLNPPSYPVRLEFIIPSGSCNLDPSQDYSGPNGGLYGTAVQLATGPGTYNFILSYPSDFSSEADPKVFVPCYTNGDPLAGGNSGTADAFVDFNYFSSGYGSNSGRPGASGPPHGVLAQNKQIGATYGVAFSKQAQKIFTSAFMKRHIGMGPLGGGGIYILDPNAPFDPNADLSFMDFDALGIATSDEANPYSNAKIGFNVVQFSPVIGSNTDRGLIADKTQPNTDPAAYSQVGKVSFGDLEISEDGRYLYLVNLYDRKLYQIDLVDPFNPQAPTPANAATRIKGFDIPDPCTTMASGEFRPFGLSVKRGKVYVGIVCSGESMLGATVGTVDDVTGTVWTFDVASESFDMSPILQFPFNYPRAKSWNPWTSSWLAGGFNEAGAPLISDIEFDASGNMIIGIRDRRGDQFGYQNNDLEGNCCYNDASVGELLRAVRDPNSQTCQFSIQFSPEYYNDDKIHAESTQGGLVVHYTPEFDGVMTTFLDPIGIWSGGVWLYDNETGQISSSPAGYEGYEVYYSAAAGGGPATLGKANGLGDIEVFGSIPTLEIGNFIWSDEDMDGIQDGEDRPLQGVIVELVNANGVVVGTSTTDANGGFYFNETNVSDPDGNPLVPGVQPYTDYVIRISATQFDNGLGQGILYGYTMTTGNAVGTGMLDVGDSDAQLIGGLPTIFITTGAPGENNHTFDMGLIPPRDFGDLPDSYVTQFGENGPYHNVTPDLYLGACVDTELDGQQEAMAGTMTGGDDFNGGLITYGTCATANDDENGVEIISPLIPGETACFRVNAHNATGNNAVLQVWIDFNNNGSIEPAEQVTTGSFAPAGATVPNGGLTDAILCFDVPATATFQGGTAYYRARLSSMGGLTDTGGADDGEVEDYKISLAKIGNLVWNDYNNDGIQNEPASAGLNGVDVVLTWPGPDGDFNTTGDNIAYSATTANMGGTDGIYMFFGLPPGMYKVGIPNLPATFIPTQFDQTGEMMDSDNPTGEMVVIPDPIMLPTGENGTGDNPGGTNGFPDASDDLTFDFGLVSLDYGDLPDTYGTTDGSNGPTHVVTPDLYLGSCIDAESDGQPDPMAGFMSGGDDNNTGGNTEGACATAGDDEDGIRFVTPLIPGYQACIEVTAHNSTGFDGVLQGWMDFNGNGTFETGEEMVFVGGGFVPNGGLTNQRICFDVPATATFEGGQAMSRFRLTLGGGYDFDGPPVAPSPTGEVEDYKVPLAKIGNLVWFDYNTDGIQNEPAVAGIDGIDVLLTWAGPDADFNTPADNIEYTTTTALMGGFNGMYMFTGLTSGAYKVSIPNIDFLPTTVNATSAFLDSDDHTGTMVMIPTPLNNLPTGENGTGDNPGGTFGYPDNQDDLSLDFGFLGLDYGDLPDSYSTTDGATGPKHAVSPNLHLGFCVDSEIDGQPEAMAGFMTGGDDNNAGDAELGTCGVPGDDEDGIDFATPLIPGYQACLSVTATNNTGNPAVLQGWIDFDADGQFGPGEELVFTNGGVVANGGVNNALYCFDVPAGATFQGGNAFARFRLSPNGGLNFNNPIGDPIAIGEVEDYKEPLAKIGNLVWNDYNNDGQQDEPASAGLDGVDVELTWPGPDGDFNTAADNIVYSTTTSTMGGTPGIYMFFGLTSGMYKVTLPNLPATFIPTQIDQGSDVSDSDDPNGQMVMVPTPLNTLPTGENSTGDNPGGTNGFPDNQDDLSIDFGLVSLDYGDLPDTYGTTEGENGPTHTVTPYLYLGSCIDSDDDGSPEAMAGFMTGGDDADTGANTEGTCATGGDDEDGIVFATPLIPGYQACVSVTAHNSLGANAVLQAWFDFDGNGSFDATEEVTFTNAGVVADGGVTDELYCFDVPATATFQGGQILTRFRLSPNGGLAADGPATAPIPMGEVEDHKEPLAKIGNLVWNDYNNDGQQDEPASAGLDGVDVELTWPGPDGDFNTAADNIVYSTTTSTMGGTPGIYMFFGLTSGMYKVTLPNLPATFIPTQIDPGSDVSDSDDPNGQMVMVPTL
ncbi:MAG: SdrD B-like domain-containing protein [Saprospiraceae bacterium]